MLSRAAIYRIAITVTVHNESVLPRVEKSAPRLVLPCNPEAPRDNHAVSPEAIPGASGLQGNTSRWPALEPILPLGSSAQMSDNASSSMTKTERRHCVIRTDAPGGNSEPLIHPQIQLRSTCRSTPCLSRQHNLQPSHNCTLPRQGEWPSSRSGGGGLDGSSFWRNTLHAMAGRAKHVAPLTNKHNPAG